MRTNRLKVFIGLVSVIALLAVSCSKPATRQPRGAGKWAQGVHIVFFPGGPQGGVFAVNVYNGAKQAEADLGVKVDYVWSDWDPQKMIQQFQEAVATKPDGIAIMGHPGDAVVRRAIDQAEAKGIIVTSQNTTLPRRRPSTQPTASATWARKTTQRAMPWEPRRSSASASRRATSPWCGAFSPNRRAASAQRASSTR